MAKQAKANKVNAIANVATLAFRGAQALTDIKEAIDAAGGDQPTVKAAFVKGWTCGILHRGQELTNAMLASVAALLERGAKRTPEQDKAIKAAGKQWTRMLAKAKVKSTEKRGGARPPKTEKAKADATPKASAAPKVKSRDAAIHWTAVQAAALLMFANKNGDRLPAPIGEAIKALHAAIAGETKKA